MTQISNKEELEPSQSFDSLSYDELRSKIIKQYSKSGIIKSLRTQLRSKILLDIKGKELSINNYVNDSHSDENESIEGIDKFDIDGFGELNTKNQVNTKRKRKSKYSSIQRDKENVSPNSEDVLKQQLLYSILLSFLNHHGLNYTISVFLSEADVSDQLVNSNSFNLLCEMFRRDHLPFNSQNKKKFSNKNFLEKKADTLEMLYDLVSQFLNINSTTQSIQADVNELSPKSTVDEKLKALDEQYLKNRSIEETTSKSIEERMIEFQNKCELRARKEIEEKMAFFEETTLSTMRLEESAKYREKIATIKEQLENDYKEKLKDLNRREQETREALESKQKEIESKSHEHRQNMMKEITKLQSKQNQMRKMEIEIERSRQEVADKARRLEALHHQTSIDMKTELEVLKQQLENKFEQNEQELEVQRQMFEKEKLQLQLEKDTIDKTYRAHGDVARFKETIEQQSQTISSLKSEISTVRLENKHLKTVCDELRHENSQLKYSKGNNFSQIHLTLDGKYESLLKEKQSLNEMNEIQLVKIQDLLKRNEILEKENTNIKLKLESERQIKHVQNEDHIKKANEELLKEKNNIRLLSSKWSIEKNSLQEKISTLEEAKETLYREIDEEKLKNKKLSMEITDVQTLLRETQQALETALKGDSSSELQSLAERRERAIKDLQRELEQLKQEKNSILRDLNSKIDEEIRHSSTLKEALAHSQKLLEKAQSSFSEAAISQDQIARQNQSEIQRLENKYEVSLKVEREKFDVQLSKEREYIHQLETSKINLNTKIENLDKQIQLLENDKLTLEKSLREYENRIQIVMKQSDLTLKQLHDEIDQQFKNHIQALNSSHVYEIKENLPTDIYEILQLLGNPKYLDSKVRYIEQVLNLPERPTFDTASITQNTKQSSSNSQTKSNEETTSYKDFKETSSFLPINSNEIITIHKESLDEKIENNNHLQTQSTSLTTSPDNSDLFLPKEIESSDQENSPISQTFSAPITNSIENKFQKTEEQVNQELKNEQVDSKKDELGFGLKSFTENYKKQLQEERFDDNDENYIDGFDNEDVDLDFIKSSDEEPDDDILGDDNDDYF